MSFKWFDWYSWLISSLFSFVLILIIGQVLLVFPQDLPSIVVVFGGLFSFDLVSYYLILLSSFLWISLGFWFCKTSALNILFISFSILCSFFCYLSVHALWFWLFYEMSIIFLFVLLVLESPYSERYIASWYLLGYIVLTSLPMLLCFLFCGSNVGSFDIRLWAVENVDEVNVICLFVLGVMFITKIPLLPFHVWLPIVHAEASSPVSVCLSGYIMKLGLLGVCRFCCFILPTGVFNNFYIWVCFLGSLFFFLAASRELDGKRWLAFLSLAHICVACAILCVGSWVLGGVSFLYCLGHGLSAGVIFLFLWFVYDISSTRNLLLLKSGVSGSLLFRVVGCSCLCTACSLPPTVQFFSEVFLVSESSLVSIVFIILIYLYLFAGGLLPLFVVGGVISRHCDVSVSGDSGIVGVYSMIFLLFWGFLLFLVG